MWFAGRSSAPLPITALASSTAKAPAAIINAAVEKPESQSFCRPVPASDSRKITSAAANTGASTANTIITSRWSVETSLSRSRNSPTAPPNAAPASIQPNHSSLSRSRITSIPIRWNISEISRTSRKLTPTNARLAAPITASVHAWLCSRSYGICHSFQKRQSGATSRRVWNRGVATSTASSPDQKGHSIGEPCILYAAACDAISPITAPHRSAKPAAHCQRRSSTPSTKTMVEIATNAASPSSNGAGSATYWRSTSMWNKNPATAQIAARIHGRSGHGGSLSLSRADTGSGESGAMDDEASVMASAYRVTSSC